jgi:hypothetical protein
MLVKVNMHCFIMYLEIMLMSEAKKLKSLVAGEESEDVIELQ